MYFMPYKFTFDLSKIPRFFFTEVAKVGYKKGLHKKVGRTVQDVVNKFKIQEATGLNLSDAVLLIEDLVEMQARNLLERETFVQTRKRALFLPHCSRKYMDNRCKAVFDPNVPSYFCAHCSSDCLINRAVSFAERKGYDVYVLPGGSCVPKILKFKHYEGAVGVACGEELRMSGEVLQGMGVAGQAVPLIKNGCANTIFNIETLFKIL
jgi:hypothetical protein